MMIDSPEAKSIRCGRKVCLSVAQIMGCIWKIEMIPPVDNDFDSLIRDEMYHITTVQQFNTVEATEFTF